MCQFKTTLSIMPTDVPLKCTLTLQPLFVFVHRHLLGHTYLLFQSTFSEADHLHSYLNRWRIKSPLENCTAQAKLLFILLLISLQHIGQNSTKGDYVRVIEKKPQIQGLVLTLRIEPLITEELLNNWRRRKIPSKWCRNVKEGKKNN